MKKLMKAVAASAVALAASGAFADLPSPADPVGFEAFTAGTKYTVSQFVERTDAGETSGSRYWYAITNASQDASAELATINNDSAQHNYLTIEAQAPLYRTINASGEYGAALSATAENIPATGIYLDTMVKFTVSSDEFKDGDLDTADKLAITCYSADDSNVTNIIVRAGYVYNCTIDSSSITPTNYVMGLPANFDVDAWHQLTVRAIADVGIKTAPVGFAVYLDQKLLKYGTDVAAGDSTYTGALNAAVTQNLYNSETHALLPSLVAGAATGSGTLTAVGFKGTGSLDNIQFTDEKPSFIVEGIAVSIAWDAGVATYTVVDSNNKTLVDAAATSGAAGSTNLTLDAGVTYLTVIATYATGYESGTWTVTGEGAQISGGTFTVVDGAELKIVSMVPMFDVGGDHYGTFEKALENAKGTSGSPATIKLMADYTGDIHFDQTDANYIILDLAGKTLTGGEDAAIHTGVAVLTITNSTETIGHVVAPEDGLAVVCDGESLLTVTAGIFDGEIADDSGETATIVINAGTFYDPYYAVDQTRDFYLKSNVPDGTSISAPSNYYFTVGGAAEPTKIAVPTAASNLVYDGTEKTGVAAGEGYTLSGDFKATNAGEYTATATLDEGYIWSDDTTEAKVFNWSIAAKTDAEVVVTLTSQIAEYTAQLAFPTATANVGNEAVVGTTAWDPATITEPNAGETNTYTVTFAVTTANYAGSTGTATFKVWKAASSGDEYPSYIDPTDTDATAKYDAWATYAGVDVAAGEVNEEAFLLNCKPAEVTAAKAAFKFTSISYDATQKKWVATTTTSYNEREFNGKITVKQYSDVGCKTESETGTFFRAVLQ